MIYQPSPLEFAAARTVEAAIPLGCTPPRLERRMNFHDAQADLARLSTETVIAISETGDVNPKTIVPLGIYATRDALASIVETDSVDHLTAGRVADELQVLCNFFLKNRIDLHSRDGNILGYSAELGIANMIWAGIADCELGLSYGILMGESGVKTDVVGPRTDVDLITRSSSPNKMGRKKVQVKASTRRAGHVYSEDITVIAAQDLIETETPFEAVAKLLKWEKVKTSLKSRVYKNLQARLRN